MAFKISFECHLRFARLHLLLVIQFSKIEAFGLSEPEAFNFVWADELNELSLSSS